MIDLSPETVGTTPPDDPRAAMKPSEIAFDKAAECDRQMMHALPERYFWLRASREFLLKKASRLEEQGQ